MTDGSELAMHRTAFPGSDGPPPCCVGARVAQAGRHPPDPDAGRTARASTTAPGDPARPPAHLVSLRGSPDLGLAETRNHVRADLVPISFLKTRSSAASTVSAATVCSAPPGSLSSGRLPRAPRLHAPRRPSPWDGCGRRCIFSVRVVSG